MKSELQWQEEKAKPIEKSEHNHALAFKGISFLLPATAFCAFRSVIVNLGSAQKENWESTGTEN